MTDVLIEHCRVRVVRRGGWGWGGNRNALVDSITKALPALLSDQLSEIADGLDRDVILDQPVVLRMKLDRAILKDPKAFKNTAQNAFGEQMQDLIAEGQNAEKATATKADADPNLLAEQNGQAAQPLPTPTPLTLLLDWRDQDQLWQRIAGFTPLAAKAWLQTVVRSSSIASPQCSALAEARELTKSFAERLATADHNTSQDTFRLFLAVELAARFPESLSKQDFQALIDTATPAQETKQIAKDSKPTAADFQPTEETSAPQRTRVERQIPATTTPTREIISTRNGEIPLSSILPFLVLGELQRISCMDVVYASFDAADASADLPAFAGALACKLLSPPERGWRRSPDDLRAASVFAGDQNSNAPPPFPTYLTDAALSPAVAFIVAELGNGHDPALPVFLTKHDDVWLLLDADGNFPVALATEPGVILEALNRFPTSPILLDTASAADPMIQKLTERNRWVVTNARPSRHDNLRPVAPGMDFWTNAPSSVDTVAASTRHFDALEEAAQTTWTELHQDRPVSTTSDPSLDQALMVLVGAGLGMLAWHLWKDEGTTDPALALIRLGDWEGTAKFTETSVEIRPALGRRYMDLREAGALRPITGVPWFQGRSVQFIGP